VLSELDVLVLDCQATGATPAHGDLLELGWGVCGGRGLASPAHARWILPQSDRGVSRTVRELTGWDDACLDVAVDAAHAWNELAADASLARGGVPTVIHFARFELPFLRQLHARTPVSRRRRFPSTRRRLHAIAQRLYPDLPRRNLRALAGHLTHRARRRRRRP
jgi:DNA polymerase III epsilon subunit-like protein